MSTPTDGELSRLVNGSTADRLVKLWGKPIEGAMAPAGGALDKPLAEVTLNEMLAVVAVFGYAILTGLVIGKLAANLASVAIRGR